MTVREAIKVLSKMDQDAEFVISSEQYGRMNLKPITKIEEVLANYDRRHRDREGCLYQFRNGIIKAVVVDGLKYDRSDDRK